MKSADLSKDLTEDLSEDFCEDLGKDLGMNWSDWPYHTHRDSYSQFPLVTKK